MTCRERLVTALEGGTPDRTPLSIYDWEMGAVTSDALAQRMNEPAWQRLLDMGLGVRHHCPTVRAIEHGVETVVEETTRNGFLYRTETKTTPIGTIHNVTRDGWHHEEWIKTPEDYRIQQWIVEQTELVPNYESYERAEEVVGSHGVVVATGAGIWRHRTPLMSINIDWVGTEQFCLDLGMELSELFDLYETQKQHFLEEQRLIAAGPGRYVVWFENLTIDMLGPRRYGELLMPVYREATPILEFGEKRVLVHYDGEVGLVADQIAEAPFHGIDSLTESPEGDMTYDRCRQAWPNLVLWANINVDLYGLPPNELQQAVIEKRQRAGKQAFAFQISEERPVNWAESIPIVLQTLDQLD